MKKSENLLSKYSNVVHCFLFVCLFVYCFINTKLICFTIVFVYIFKYFDLNKSLSHRIIPLHICLKLPECFVNHYVPSCIPTLTQAYHLSFVLINLTYLQFLTEFTGLTFTECSPTQYIKQCCPVGKICKLSTVQITATY